MKTKLCLSILTVAVLLGVYITPVQWLMVELQMSKAEVYEQCGPPESTDLIGVKGERWIEAGPLWKWTMFVGFKVNKVVHSSIWLDVGWRECSVRVYISDDGKIDLGI